MKKLFIDWAVPVIVAVIISILINKFLFFQANVPTLSMYPTVDQGDRVIVTRTYNKSKLKRGDIIVFYSNELEKRLLKRLIGLPGDKIELKSGDVYINGKFYEELYVVNNSERSGVFQVPEDHYFFLGDNRPISNDASMWQQPYIKKDFIEGKAQYIIYPFTRFSKLQ